MKQYDWKPYSDWWRIVIMIIIDTGGTIMTVDDMNSTEQAVQSVMVILCHENGDYNTLRK